MLMALLLIFLVIVLRFFSTGDDGTKTVQIMVPLKYLSNFWRTFEMPLINCAINHNLTWSANCVISNAAASQMQHLQKLIQNFMFHL